MLRDVHPNPDNVRRGRGGGTAVLGDGVRTPCGQSGSLRGLEWIPAKWRCLVPGERRDGAQSPPCCAIPRRKHAGHNASRWAVSLEITPVLFQYDY
jgi:hypothetical protein